MLLRFRWQARCVLYQIRGRRISIKPACSHGSKSCLFQFSGDCRVGFARDQNAQLTVKLPVSQYAGILSILDEYIE